MSDEGLVLALDQGTTSSRAILFDHAGAIVARASRELPQLYPAPGQVEHDPEAIWESQLAVAREVLAEADVRRVAAGRHRRHQPARDDHRLGAGHRPPGRTTRSSGRAGSRAGYCDELRARGPGAARPGAHGPAHRRLLLAAPRSTTSWRPTPGLQARAERGELLFGTVDSFLIWRLTGGALHVTDVSNASRTLLFDIHRLAWDDELLAAMDVPRRCCPRCGRARPLTARRPPGCSAAPMPIAGDAGDQQAATFGQACFSPGMAKKTYGTGGFLLLNTGERAVASRARAADHGRLAARRQAVTYALEGSVFIAGAVVQWLRDGLGIIRESADVEAPGRAGRGHRRRLRRARLRRPRRAVLGPLRPRHDHRPDARHDRGPHRARHRRRHGLPDPRRRWRP